MSIRVMTLVTDRFPGGGSDLIAMLLLADLCSDDGDSLYPSIAFLAAKMRVSESQARRVLHGLINAGYIAVVGNPFGGAPGATRAYRLSVEKLRDLPILPKIAQHLGRSAPHRKRSHVGGYSHSFDDETGRVGDTPSTHATPSMDARDGSHGCAGGLAPMRETGRMGDTQSTMNHQLTIKEPSEKRKKAKSPNSDDLSDTYVGIEELALEGVDRQHARDWLLVRKAKRMPLTQSAWIATKAEADKAGLSSAQAVKRAAESGWAGFRASFVADSTRAAQPANRQQKFDPLAYVNRNRTDDNDRADFIIDV
ncbi:helix-turn-helix domain-containing protein [Paraburkholderia sediminicola]|uniref:helix-turn-helix domain-containing protein n=1 Tax=Paraburkholderia sediminicola TaxID=458836 RepID=UPI0038BB3E0C